MAGVIVLFPENPNLESSKRVGLENFRNTPGG